MDSVGTIHKSFLTVACAPSDAAESGLPAMRARQMERSMVIMMMKKKLLFGTGDYFFPTHMRNRVRRAPALPVPRIFR